MVSLAELRKQKLKELEESKIQPEEKVTPGKDKILAAKKVTDLKKVSISVLASKDFEIKTDHLRTGISLIIGASKRDQPPILKEKLLEFLNKHELIKKDRTWYWSNIP